MVFIFFILASHSARLTMAALRRIAIAGPLLYITECDLKKVRHGDSQGGIKYANEKI